MPDYSPLHRDLSFCSPLSDQRASELCRFVARSSDGGTVVDVACGWAELLIRLLERSPDLRGIGIDLDRAAIDHGRQQARDRGVGDRLDLITGDTNALLPERADAVLCIGASQIWGPPVEANLPLDYRSALTALRRVLEPGAPAVFGEHIWIAEPTPAAVAPLAGRTDELVFLPDLLDIARDSGFLVERTHQASQDEWDRFESGFTAGYVHWLTDHPTDHPDAETVRAKLQAQNDAYHRGYRDILGMAYLELRAV